MPQKKKCRCILALYIALRVLVILTMVAQLVRGNYGKAFLCVLTLILFLIPVIAERGFHVKLPSALEAIILLFIFSTQILGEIDLFYKLIPCWDTILHTTHGFLMAAIGFAMIDILNQDPRIHVSLSPVSLAVVALCFSMTVSVLWEFVEFGMDQLFAADTQNDYLVDTISSVDLDLSGENVPVVIDNIESTVIRHRVDGIPTETVIQGGYLELGIIDTMKDLIANFCGAILFSFIGIFGLKKQGRLRKFVESLIPQMMTQAEIAETKRERDKFSKKLWGKVVDKIKRLCYDTTNKKK